MGINLLLDISRQSFRALDAAMNVAGQNVANAETEGYHRRRLDLTAVEMSPRGILGGGQSGSVGGGVSVTAYERMRDVMLDHARWEARGGLANANEQERVMAAVEAIFPTGAGSLEQTLDEFWNGWADLGDHPTDVGVRLSLTGRAETLASRLHTLDSGLDRLQTETRLTLEDHVNEANRLIGEIADLNVTVAHARRAGSADAGAEDALGLKLEALSSLLPARFENQPDGSTSVYLGGMNLVQLGETTTLTLQTSGGSPSVTIGDTGLAFPTGQNSGKIGAILGPVLGSIAETRTKLDTIAQTLVTEVNALHSAGYGLDGVSGRDFFDPAGVSAGTIAVSAAVKADPSAIAAGQDAAAQGDNSNALDIHDLRFAGLMESGTQTVGDYAIDVVTGIGASVASARSRATGAESTVSGLDAMARGVSAVSIDDEMVGLIKLQQAYAASARLLSVADEMFSSLLAI